jgi:hypothetical protein
MRHAVGLLVSFGSFLLSCGREVDETHRALSDNKPRLGQLSSDLHDDVEVKAHVSKDLSLNQNASSPSMQMTASSSEYFCPSGFYYSSSDRLCVTQTEAFGPFTREMISLCKKYGGGESACESQRWSRSFAVRLRQSGQCPRGSEYDEQRAVCRDGNEAYGPFKKNDVEYCLSSGGGNVCETMRWYVGFVPTKVTQKTTNQKLFEYYSKRENYNQVFSDVLKFYPTGRSNGCVAFMSSALRRVGVNIPIGVYIGGESVSLVTKPFSRYLTETLGWMRINDANSLQPGDVVLTEDDRRYPGYPAHTYMFHSWSDRSAGIGWVIDNQDFIHERNVFGYGSYNFTPFAYALRSLE